MKPSRHPTESVAVAALSDLGQRRESNEDALGLFPEHGLFVVADGMGGHAAGEVASQMAVQAVSELLPRLLAEVPSEDPRGMGNALMAAVRSANQRVWEAGAARPDWRGMGTTLDAALVRDDQLWLGHAGDGRVYVLRNGTLRQMTRDHTLVAEHVRLGLLKPEDAASHPFRSLLTRALGTDEDLTVDQLTLDLQPGDTILLCTDGLYGMVPDEKIREVLLSTQDLEEACRKLVGLANDAGGNDNITVLLVRWGEHRR